MRSLIGALSLTLAACGTGAVVIDDEGGDELLEVAEGPLLGANGKDASDRSCNVVLRSLARVPNGPGFTTRCTATGGCQVVWAGVLDVSEQAVAEGARPGVLWKNQDARSWSSLTARRVTGAPQGFVRFSFRLDRNTMSDGMSATALSRARIDVAPFIRMPTGARLFDKQRGQGDFDNYALSQAGGWAVVDDAGVCGPPAPPASLDFSAGFQLSQRGALVAGGRGVITYSLERLTTCRGTHNGHPAWDVTAFVRFSPGGEVVSGSVRGFNAPGGTPSNSSAVSVPFTFQVPSTARTAEVWFKNATGAGSTCEAWDSNLGANYRFDVEAKAFAPVQWVGRPGASTNRACSRSEGAPDVLTLDSYLQQRACVWYEADAYVPGLTDGVGGLKAHAVFAEAVLVLDGVAQPSQSLSFIGRVGNDYRYRFELPKSGLYYGPKWTELAFTLRFSTDGRTWVSDTTRRVRRDASFCNPAWGACAL
ncbi:MAG: DUF6209 family protein [Myxococcaceae bacterium]|nr:DUF6209 family protein [Myxococcaceae bacterium]